MSPSGKLNNRLILRWLPTVSSKVKKEFKFQPQKLPIDISEKNETKVIYWITFKASSAINRWSVTGTSVAITTVAYENGGKFTFNQLYFANEFGDPWFFLHWNFSSPLSNE